MTPTRAARISSLRSMTGFGRAEVSAGPITIAVEARSLNHRHGDVTLAWVLERPGVVRLDEADAPAPDTAWPVLSDALARALDELILRRTAEGEALGAELQKLTADLRAQTDLVEARVPAAVERR